MISNIIYVYIHEEDKQIENVTPSHTDSFLLMEMLNYGNASNLEHILCVVTVIVLLLIIIIFRNKL